MTVVQDIAFTYGKDRTWFVGPFTQEDGFGVDQPLDLLAGGTKMWFTVKVNLEDTDLLAVIQKDETDGITLDQPVTPENNFATIEVNVADWPAEYPGPILYYDVQLLHAGEITTPFRGLVRLARAVTAATA